MTLTEGQQNQLIIDHTKIVVPAVAVFRGRKGIPFEDLISEGMATLVAAARTFDPGRMVKFKTYAERAISFAVRDFINRWQEFEAIDEISVDDEDRIHEWAMWGTLPSEGWTSIRETPEGILGIFEEFSANAGAVTAALISLDPRERKMVEAHFLRQPAVKLEQLARDHKLSYYRTIEIVYGAVKKMRDIVERMTVNQNQLGRTPRGRGFSSINIIPFERRKRA